MNPASADLALPTFGLSPALEPTPRMDRRLFIAIAVIGCHGLGLWALQSGLLQRAATLVVPVEVLAEVIEPPQARVAPRPAQTAPEQARSQPPRPRPAPQAPALQPQQQPVVAPQPAVSLAPSVQVEAPATPPLASNAAPDPAPSATTAAPTAPLLELPSSSARHLDNPPPPYPPMSKRLGEQGKVVVRAYIEVNGSASKAEIRSSSGYERLDQTALQTVLKWRYLPGKRAGVPEAMWFNVPIHFVLD